MMLLTPNWSMKLIISFCAPAVIESMATTAPTPKIMPSMVNKLRSLCANRLAMPMTNSGPILESPMAISPRPSRPWRRRPGPFSRRSSCWQWGRPWRRSRPAARRWRSPSWIHSASPVAPAAARTCRSCHARRPETGRSSGTRPAPERGSRRADLDHHHGFTLLHQLHRPRLELAVLAMHVDQKLAVLLEHGLRRNVDHVGQLFHLNLDVGQQARTK